MTQSEQLLAEYTATQSEEAFAQLVQRHLDLVYSTALRLSNNDSHLAENISQIVFSDLAVKAPRLKNTVLAGWFYRHTTYVASKTIRTACRRAVRELQATQDQPET